MFAIATVGAARTGARARNFWVIAGLGVLAGGCSSQLNSAQALLEAAKAPNLAEATAKSDAAGDHRSELQKATEYWGKAYARDPKNAQAAINYAKNLKALGEKQLALAVLQQASLLHAANRSLNAEYGRLALEFDQVSLAQKLLEQADDPANPDWRVVSARGTVLAKQGAYREAIAFYERALTLAPNEASVLNNLALAHAMLGEAEMAEPLLKRAAAAGGHEQRVSQNLALVLGLEGKYEEAKAAAARDLPADKAAATVEYVRSIAAVEPKPLTTGTVEEAPKPAAGSAAGPAADAKKQAPTKAAKKANPRRQDAKDRDAPEGVPTTDEASGWATKVAAIKSPALSATPNPR